MGTKTSRNYLSYILPFIVAVMTVILLTGIAPSKANADSNPAINAGADPNQSGTIVKGTGPNANLSMNESLYLTADNQNGDASTSNYGVAGGSDPVEAADSSVIDQDQCKNLTLHFSVTNTSANDPQKINEVIILPRYNNSHSNVSYADSKAGVTPTGYTNGLSIGYNWGGGNYNSASESQNQDWTKLLSIQFQGTLPKGQTLSVNVKLSVGAFTDQSTKSFEFQAYSYSFDNNPYLNDVTGYATFSKKVAAPTGHMVAVTKTGDQYTMIPELQQLMPTTISNLKSKSNPNGAVDEKLAGGATRNEGDFYDSDLQIVTLNHLMGQDGKTNLADTIHNLGYSFALNNGQEMSTYSRGGYWQDSKAVTILLPDGKTPVNPGTTTYDGQSLDSLYLEFEKIIDANDSHLAIGAAWDPFANTAFLDKNSKKIPTPEKDGNISYTVKKVDANGNETPVTDNKVDTSTNGVYAVTYADKINDTLTVHKTVNVTVGDGNVSTPNSTPTGSISKPNSPVTAANNPASTTESTTKQPAKTTGSATTPKGAYAKGTVVYGVKKIYLYKNATFKKSQRIAQYRKTKRVNRPMFVVTGYAYSKGGALRYKVRDVNHGTKTDKKRGYITANKKYVVKVYYSTLPKNKKVTVINQKGVNAYKQANLTKKVKNYKKGTRLTVKKLVKHNLTTRYQLSNGDYITANKKLIIQGNY